MAACSYLPWLVMALTLVSNRFALAAVQLTHLSTLYLPYNITAAGPLFNLSSDAVEQISYDPGEKITYVAGFEVIHAVDTSNPSQLTTIYSKFINGFDFTDLEVCGDYLFVTADNIDNSTEGQLQVYKKHRRQNNVAIELLRTVIVGPFPDMVNPLAGCKTILIALEAEGYTTPDNQFVDPEGAVIIVNFPDGVEGTGVSVKPLDFKAFNSRVDELLESGVRYVYRVNNTFSADLEPEFITVDPEGKTAYVNLQENNGVAVVDLTTETITNIYGYGYKQWGMLDASDRDNETKISSWPIRSWYMPDSIQFVSWQGRKLVITANEGGAKKYDHFREQIRGKRIKPTDLGSSITNEMKKWLSKNEQLGRLKFSRHDGRDANGTYQELYAFGARSFSIWDADKNFTRLYDSESEIENITMRECPHAFNTEGEDVDEKSDSKGPETEVLAVTKIGEKLYIAIANENPGTIFIYSLGTDVTKPQFETIFCEGLPNTNKTLQQKFDAREVYALDPEEMKFVSPADNPTGSTLLLVGGSVSGTLSVLQFTVTE